MLCLRCGKESKSRVPNPRYCPLCKSPKWNVPKKDSTVENLAESFVGEMIDNLRTNVAAQKKSNIIDLNPDTVQNNEPYMVTEVVPFVSSPENEFGSFNPTVQTLHGIHAGMETGYPEN